MAVWGHNRKFSHPPWLVTQLVPNRYLILYALLVQTLCIRHMQISKPRVILRLRHRDRIGTVPYPQFARTASQKRPAIYVHLFMEPKFASIKLPRCIQIVDGKHKRSRHYLCHGHLNSRKTRIAGPHGPAI